MRGHCSSCLVLVALACSSSVVSEVEGEGFSPLDLGFGLPRVPLASSVPLTAFVGAALNIGTDLDGCAGHPSSLRLVRVDSEKIAIGTETLMELDQGVPEMAMDDARVLLDEALAVRAMRGIRRAEQGCDGGQVGFGSGRVLLAIEDTMPTSTVQLVLQSMRRAGLAQPVLALDAERSPEDLEWLTEQAPPALVGPEVELDVSVIGSQGVVIMGDSTWSEAVRNHSRLAALGVGCVSYAWGTGLESEMLPTAAQSLGVNGMVSVLAISPLQISQGDIELPAQELVTGAQCEGWGRLGPLGERPRVED